MDRVLWPLESLIQPRFCDPQHAGRSHQAAHLHVCSANRERRPSNVVQPVQGDCNDHGDTPGLGSHGTRIRSAIDCGWVKCAAKLKQVLPIFPKERSGPAAASRPTNLTLLTSHLRVHLPRLRAGRGPNLRVGSTWTAQLQDQPPVVGQPTQTAEWTCTPAWMLMTSTRARWPLSVARSRAHTRALELISGSPL